MIWFLEGLKSCIKPPANGTTSLKTEGGRDQLDRLEDSCLPGKLSGLYLGSFEW
jgi:hypothetical protein